MLMLMGQPGVNLAQVHKLRMDEWRYKPANDGYEIRTYKHRRWGPVVFQIYSGFRPQFERYLNWRKTIFKNDPDGLLFPFLGRGGTQPQRRSDKPPSFDSLRAACKRAGITFVTPTALRSTNVNWMLRETQNPDLTAEEKQHAKQTLLKVYETPSLQRAMVQIQLFWAEYDPAQAAVGPGSCANKRPEAVPSTPKFSPKPDCQLPAGCMFCTHQRDIDSFDYVWSLVSFRLLKSFELCAPGQVESKKNQGQHPAEAVIQRISEKLISIKASSTERMQWLNEALIRIDEGRYHPAWVGMLDSILIRKERNL